MDFRSVEDSILMYTALAKKTYGSVDPTIVRTSVSDFVNGLNSLKLGDLSKDQVQKYQQMGLMDENGQSKLHVEKNGQSVLKPPEEVEKVFEEAKRANPSSFDNNMQSVFGQGSQMAVKLVQSAGDTAQNAGLNRPEAINLSKAKQKATEYSIDTNITTLNDSPIAEGCVVHVLSFNRKNFYVRKCA